MEFSEVKWPKGLKKTKQREDVLQVLLHAAKPLSAQEIYQCHCSQNSSEPYAVSTVYRILASFEEHGLITRQTLMGSDTAVYELTGGGHKHYAVCLNCNKMIPIYICPFERLSFSRSLKEPTGFTVTGHKLELYGYCTDCMEKKAAQD